MPPLFYDAIEGSCTETYIGKDEQGEEMPHMKCEFKINNYREQGYALIDSLDTYGNSISTTTMIQNNGRYENYSDSSNSTEDHIKELMDQYGTTKLVSKSDSDIIQIEPTGVSNPWQIARLFLDEQNEWEIQEEKEYLGRQTYVITGNISPEVKSNMNSFEMIVDKDTGVLLYYKIIYNESDPSMKSNILEVKDIRIVTDSGDSPQYSDSSILEDQSLLNVQNSEEYFEIIPYFPEY